MLVSNLFLCEATCESNPLTRSAIRWMQRRKKCSMLGQNERAKKDDSARNSAQFTFCQLFLTYATCSRIVCDMFVCICCSVLLQLSQDRMYLSDGTHVEFPDSEGVFCTDSFENLDSLAVHAPGSTNQSSDSHLAVPPANSQVGSTSTPTAGVLGSTPGFSGFKTPNRQRWVPSALSKGKGKGCVTCIKVTLAARKPDGSAGVQKSQCFPNLTMQRQRQCASDNAHDPRPFPRQLLDSVITKRPAHSRQLGYEW